MFTKKHYINIKTQNEIEKKDESTQNQQKKKKETFHKLYNI